MVVGTKVSELADAGVLNGTEEVLLVDGASSARTTTQAIADLGTTDDGISEAEAIALIEAVTAADVGAIPTTAAGAPSGVATLNASGKIPSSQIPALAIGDVFEVASEVAMLALAAESGDVAIRTDIDTTFILTNDTPGTLANWAELNSGGAVSSVNGDTGAVTIAPADLGATTIGNTIFTAADAAAVRTALALGNSAQLGVGTTAFTVAGGSDLRFTTVTANRQTGTSYTLVLTDAAKAVEMENASANTVTIPPHASVAFPTGTVVEIGQYGAGTTTIVAGVGVTIRAYPGLVIAAQYGTASLRKVAGNEWWAAGALTP